MCSSSSIFKSKPVRRVEGSSLPFVVRRTLAPLALPLSWRRWWWCWWSWCLPLHTAGFKMEIYGFISTRGRSGIPSTCKNCLQPTTLTPSCTHTHRRRTSPAIISTSLQSPVDFVLKFHTHFLSCSAQTLRLDPCPTSSSPALTVLLLPLPCC